MDDYTNYDASDDLGGNVLGGTIHFHPKTNKKYIQYTVNGVNHKTYEGTKKYASIVSKHKYFKKVKSHPTRKTTGSKGPSPLQLAAREALSQASKLRSKLIKEGKHITASEAYARVRL